MRAVAIQRYGGPEEMAVLACPEPEPAEGELLVRVAAAGVGLWDAKVRRGEAGREDEFPLVLGLGGGWIGRTRRSRRRGVRAR
jgi:NADPH:quinone reductase-like Zn-dependent oxidoreductase